jgi:hypothetical protein
MKERLDISNEKGRIAYMLQVLCGAAFWREHCLRDEYRLDTKEFVLGLCELNCSKE